MNRMKSLELARKNNARLTEQLDEAKLDLALHKLADAEGYKRAKDLITDLERIKKEWEEALCKIREKQDEYQMLVDDLKKVRKRMKGNSKKQHRWIFRRE